MSKNIIDICKVLTDTHGDLIWGQTSYTYDDVLSGFIDLEDYDDDYRLHKWRDRNLELIVEKAIQDKFPIQEYGLDDINCVDGLSIYTFSHLDENNSGQIDFVVDSKQTKAVPYKYDSTAKSLPNMVSCENCFDAVYIQ